MGLRILVAEDEFITAVDLCDTFEEAGYEVDGPYAGISVATLACQKRKPDLAILDIELADGLTYELAQLLIDDDVPVILHCEHDEAHGLAAHFGAAEIAAKPCPPTELLAAVNRLLAPA